MTMENQCEIVGCGCAVMGCVEDDSCPATRLCERHYFLMKVLCEPETMLGFGSVMPSVLFGEPNHWEKEKLRQWHARYQQSLRGVS